MDWALEQLTDGNDRTRAQWARLMSRVRQEGVVWQEEAELHRLFLSFFMHHLVIDPKPMDMVRDPLDFLVERGASPFHEWGGRSMNPYQELIMAHPDSQAVHWCRSLPVCPPCAEVDPDRRLRSDTLDAILKENPEPGDASQLSALKLFDFPLLETWSDGQTTLDRVLYRYFQWNTLNALGPRKDFELAMIQRGFARLAKELLDQAPGSPEMHAIRWFARHHAQHCAYKLGRPDRYSRWGEAGWQASVRHLDQVLCAGRKDIGKTPEQRNLALREEGVDYVINRPLPSHWVVILTAAAVYDLTDNDQARLAQANEENAGKPPHKHHDRREDAAWQLRVAQVLESVVSNQDPAHLQALFDAEPSSLVYSRNMLSLVASDPQCQTHDHMVGACLPLLAFNAAWTAQMESFERAVQDGVRWPTGTPYDEWTRQARWSPAMLACLEARTLSAATLHAVPSRGMRRI